MAVKVKETFGKNRHGKNIDKSRKYMLRGQRNARYHDIILSYTRKSYTISLKNNFIFICLS